MAKDLVDSRTAFDLLACNLPFEIFAESCRTPDRNPGSYVLM